MRNRVAELRRERNMRQEELAAAAGISRQSIIAIEKGRFNPSLEAAIRIARCFGVPVEAVFFPEADGWRCRPETGEGRLSAGQKASLFCGIGWFFSCMYVIMRKITTQ